MNNIPARRIKVWVICIVALLLSCDPGAKKDRSPSPHSTAAVTNIEIKDPTPRVFSRKRSCLRSDIEFLRITSDPVVVAASTLRQIPFSKPELGVRFAACDAVRPPAVKFQLLLHIAIEQLQLR
jgi:hypothetical protein